MADFQVIKSGRIAFSERHDFDMFESIRSAAVSEAVEQFTARIG